MTEREEIAAMSEVQLLEHCGDNAARAVEPVPVGYVEVINGKVVSVRLDKSRHRTEPVYLTPPVAPDERMRRALSWCVSEIELAGKRSRTAFPADPEKKKLFDEAKAISRADEGKECLREGTVISYESTNGVGKVLSVNRPSDPSPPDATAQREAIARALHKAHMPFCDYTYPFEHELSGRLIYERLADAVMPFLALQPRAGG